MIARLRLLITPAPLALALTLLVAAAALIVALAEAQIIRYVDFPYLLAENLLLVAALLSVLLALITRRPDAPNDGETGQSLAPALVALVVGGLGIVLLARYQEGLSLYDVLLVILLALAVEAGAGLLRTARDEAPAQTAPRFSVGTLVALGGVLLLTVLLRLLGPGSALLVYVFAPLAVFVVPGLALSLALLDADTPPLAHAALAPALSVAVEAVYLAWLAQLGIAISPLSLFAGVIGVTLIGAGVFALRRRQSGL
ncbi:MAG: hypothetical protein JNL42_16855 [Anaerolineae bacterium]|nr:hypothetical protein [Anaerolineae bacterium]